MATSPFHIWIIMVVEFYIRAVIVSDTFIFLKNFSKLPAFGASEFRQVHNFDDCQFRICLVLHLPTSRLCSLRASQIQSFIVFAFSEFDGIIGPYSFIVMDFGVVS